MNRRKKLIYTGVIGLALAGVLIDRLSSGVTSGVSTAVAVSPAPIAGNASPVSEGLASLVSIRPTPFPTPVAQVGLLDGQERDPFAISAAALAQLRPPNANGRTPETGALDQVTRDSFDESHRLEAILHAAGETVAVVDGVLVRVGQSLDGCQLTEVEPRTAVFDCGDGAITLDLDELLPGVTAAPVRRGMFP